MPLQLNRAQQRFLGLSAPHDSHPDEEIDLVTRLSLHQEMVSALRNFLHVPGAFRGGPLYGHQAHGILHVRLAAPGGYAWWLPDADPLALDERYTLGWSDCLSALYGDQLSWSGQWLIFPHRRLEGPEEHLQWLKKGVAQGLIDTDHPLLIVGWEDGRLDTVAASFDQDSKQVIELQVHLEIQASQATPE